MPNQLRQRKAGEIRAEHFYRRQAAGALLDHRRRRGASVLR